MIKYRPYKYSLFGLFIAALYWFIDSSIHYFGYSEADFEIIPSEFNELWMRTAIFTLVIGFGAYVDISVKRIRILYEERYQLQLELDRTLTKLLGGFVSICCVCKKVNSGSEQVDKDRTWETIESYISERSDLEFSHGYCPECAANVMKGMKAVCPADGGVSETS